MTKGPLQLNEKDEARFWARVSRGKDASDCWHWTGRLYPRGYGEFSLGGRTHRAHRIAYELLVGPIPDGLVIDHLCRNIVCVNPAHLEAVTQTENIRRGIAPSAEQRRQTHCKRGHPLSGENLKIRANGSRLCRECQRQRRRKRRQEERRQKKAAAVAAPAEMKAIMGDTSARRFKQGSGAPPLWHIAVPLDIPDPGGIGYFKTGCGALGTEESLREDPTAVPLARRCQANGCRYRWAAVDPQPSTESEEER